MIHACYLAALVVGAALCLALYFGLTFVIAPLGVSPLRVSMDEVNQFTPRRRDIDRILKPYKVWRYLPKTVFLGTSRIHQSLDPAVLDGTRYAPAYNASIPASSLGLNISHLQRYVELIRGCARCWWICSFTDGGPVPAGGGGSGALERCLLRHPLAARRPHCFRARRRLR